MDHQGNTRPPGRGRRRLQRPCDRGPRLALLLTLAALLSSGCSLFFRSPRVSIADVRVASVGLVGGTAEVLLRVENRNGFALTAKEIRYRLSYEDREAERGWRLLTEGQSDEQVRVPARDTMEVRLAVPFRYADVGRALGSLLNEGELNYRIEGDVQFDAPITDIRVPFDRRGSFMP